MIIKTKHIDKNIVYYCYYENNICFPLKGSSILNYLVMEVPSIVFKYQPNESIIDLFKL